MGRFVTVSLFSRKNSQQKYDIGSILEGFIVKLWYIMYWIDIENEQ